MTTVKELIKYLKTLPEETECTVMVGNQNGWDFYMEEVSMDLKEFYGNVDYLNLTGNYLVKEDDPRYNKKYLTFGAHSV